MVNLTLGAGRWAAYEFAIGRRRARCRGSVDWEAAALLDISHIGQIGFGVADIDRAEDFYGRALGLRKLFRFGDLTFFDCGGIRLLLEKRRGPGDPMHGGTIYLRCADLALAVEELRARGVTFSLGPHLIARMDDHDLWMAFFLDPDGNSLALMQEAPKGYSPVADRPSTESSLASDAGSKC